MQEEEEEAYRNNNATADRTPIPSDWEHTKILIGRTFRKDRHSPKLYAARFFLMPVMLMLYCIGFLIAGQSYHDDSSVIVGVYKLFKGEGWTFPQQVRLAGMNGTFVEIFAATLEDSIKLDNSMDIKVETFPSNNRTDFLDICQENIASSASEEVCVYLDAPENYTIYYGGDDTATPYQPALAGTQWIINSALLELADNSTTNAHTDVPRNVTFPVSQIQRVPEKVGEKSNEPVAIVLLLPPVMHILACAVAAQFLSGPITYEKVNHVAESFLFVGVKMRTYLFQWVAYFSLNFISTAILLTVVSEYWYLMPMSSHGLVFISHYLGLVSMACQFILLMQFVQQEELASGIPFLTGIFCMAMGVPLLALDYVDSIFMYILSIPFPFVGMMQYYGTFLRVAILGG